MLALLIIVMLVAFGAGAYAPRFLARLGFGAEASAGTRATARAFATAALVVLAAGLALLFALTLNWAGGAGTVAHAVPTDRVRTSAQLLGQLGWLLAMVLGALAGMWAPNAYERTHEALARTREHVAPATTRRPGYISASVARPSRTRPVTAPKSQTAPAPVGRHRRA